MEHRGSVGWTVAATSFGFALIQLDVTVVNVALPRIATALGTGIAGLQWVVDAYALVLATLLLSAGFFGDRFGARRVYLGGMGLFAAASLGCGLAENAGMLIAARVVQGVGAAAMLPTSLALLNHAAGHDAGLRAKAVGWWTAAGAITIAAGPVVGGLMLGLAGWRSIFLVNLPVCALGAALALKVAETPRKTGRGFDLAGQVLGVLALGALTAAVIEARPLGVLHPVVLTAAGVGVAAAVGFVLAEAKAPSPMLPLELFRNRTFSAAVGYGVAANLTYYGLVFVLSLYLQRVLGYGPVKTGLAYLPLTATFFFVNVASGWWIARAGSRPPMAVGAVVDAVGFALLLRLGGGSSYWLMAPAFALIPGGMGFGVPAMTTAVLASVDKHMSGVAAGALNAARQAAGAIGVALFGAFAGDGRDHVVAGLHLSAIVAVGLLIIACALAVFGVRPQEVAAEKAEAS